MGFSLDGKLVGFALDGKLVGNLVGCLVGLGVDEELGLSV